MGASGIHLSKDYKLEPLAGTEQEWENSIRTGKVSGDVEHGALYTKDGEPIVGYLGEAHSTPVDHRVFDVEGASFTHYHPDKAFGGTLSMADLKVFSESKLDNLRAVTSQGYLYSIKANENVDRAKLGKWVDKNKKMAQKNFDAAYTSALKKATTPLKSGPHKGKVKLTNPMSGKTIYRNPMTPKQAANFARKYSVQMFDRMYKKNLAKFGITYTATKKI